MSSFTRLDRRRPSGALSLAGLGLAGLLAFPGALQAQDRPAPETVKPDAPTPKDEAPESAFVKQMIGVLRDELDLTQEQVSRVTAILEATMKEALKVMMKRLGDEAPDPAQMKKDQDELRERTLAKIRELLDDGQRRELEALVKEFEQRSGRWDRGRGLPGGDASAWLEGDQPTRERLLAHADKALILNEDEKAALLPVMDRVVTARLALREARRQRRKDLAAAVHGGASEGEVKERLHDFRAKEASAQQDLERAEDELRQLVTIEQEARLVAIGILD